MLVCHCRAQSERTIRECIQTGARDREDLAERCGAGTGCGGCLPALQALLDEALGAQPAYLQSDQVA